MPSDGRRAQEWTPSAQRKPGSSNEEIDYLGMPRGQVGRLVSVKEALRSRRGPRWAEETRRCYEIRNTGYVSP